MEYMLHEIYKYNKDEQADWPNYLGVSFFGGKEWGELCRDETIE